MQFSSPEHALRWSYEISNRPIVKVSSINGMRGPESAITEEITSHDQHAQAALIIGMCERILSPLHMAYVRVQFGRENGGFDLLGRHLVGGFGTGLHSRRGIEQIIRAYCGEKIGLRELKKSMSCGMLKAASLRSRGYDMLDSLHAQAMDTISQEMEERNLKIGLYSPRIT
jgi:hypothetical protein